MTKHTNPFYTIDEAVAVLQSLDASPLRNLPAWDEQILSIMVNRKYEGGSCYFGVSILILKEGFDALLELLPKDFDGNPQFEPVRTKHTPEFDKLAIYLDHPGHMLEVMALIPREDP